MNYKVQLEKAKNEWWESDLIKNYYGFDIKKIHKTPLFETILAWTNNNNLNFVKGNHYNRVILEKYFKESGLIPIKLAAIKLGMEEKSFRKVMDKMVEKAIFPRPSWNIENELITESTIKDFGRFFKNLKNSVFSSDNDFIFKTHQTIKETLDIDVEPLFCSISKLLNECPIKYAQQFCILSFEPLSSHNRIWVNFYRNTLIMDSCSPKIYIEDESNQFLTEFIETKPDKEFITKIKSHL
jgi:hypothetical protein